MNLIRKPLFISLVCVLVTSCSGLKNTAENNNNLVENYKSSREYKEFIARYPKPDSKRGEKPDPEREKEASEDEKSYADKIEKAKKELEDEKDNAYKIAKVIEAGIRRNFPSGNAIRDAHPKAHGCVMANFKIEKSLKFDSKDGKLDFAKGIFQPGNSYPAWVRFSNSNENPDRPDSVGDGRGMAIKIGNMKNIGSQGASKDLHTHDFIMIDHPTFIIDDPSSYLSLITAVNTENPAIKFLRSLMIPFHLGIKGLINFISTSSSKLENPLFHRYWSMVPYQLGLHDEAKEIKFSVQNCNRKDAIETVSHEDPNYLGKAMYESLAQGSACMEFMVQPRSGTMDVENSRDEWEEGEEGNKDKSKFYKVATITIHQQEFNDTYGGRFEKRIEKEKFCENLSFNPWNSLPSHKPLGAVNRLRKGIYEHISRVRHEINGEVSSEPNF